MCFIFKKNNERTEKPVNCFLQDGASVSMRSLQTSIVTKLCQMAWNGLQIFWIEFGQNAHQRRTQGITRQRFRPGCTDCKKYCLFGLPSIYRLALAPPPPPPHICHVFIDCQRLPTIKQWLALTS